MPTDDQLSTLPEVNLTRKAGRPLKTGDQDKEFSEFLERYGLDKAKWLDMADKSSKTFTDNLFKRAKALEVLRRESEAILDIWNSTNARGLTIYEDLVKLSIDIQERLNRKREENPDYDPLEDKVLQSALKRKNDMLVQMEKMKIDVKRLVLDEKHRRESANGDSAKVIDASTATLDDFEVDDVQDN